VCACVGHLGRAGSTFQPCSHHLSLICGGVSWVCFITSSAPSLQELKEVGREQPRLEAEHPANTTKNRYPHVLPCECWEHGEVTGRRPRFGLEEGLPVSGY
jgi:hypothetical protein